MNNKLQVIISSRGAGGNIYSILANVRVAMRKVALVERYNKLYCDVSTSDSYAAAIARIRQDVELVDTDGEV
jgi:hypothetical protein